MTNYNHKVEGLTLNIKVLKTGSRNRVRIPVCGAHCVGFKPGDKALVVWNCVTEKLNIFKSAWGNYTVEKDGAIRFPIKRFGLPNQNLNILANQGDQKVYMEW